MLCIIKLKKFLIIKKKINIQHWQTKIKFADNMLKLIATSSNSKN